LQTFLKEHLFLSRVLALASQVLALNAEIFLIAWWNKLYWLISKSMQSGTQEVRPEGFRVCVCV